MVIRAIIFDLFGVLVLPGYTTLFNDFPDKKSGIEKLISDNNDGLMSRRIFYKSMAELLGIDVEEVKSYYRRDYARDEAAIDWVMELKKFSNLKLGMLSNVGHGWVKDFFTQEELSRLFDGVILSSDVGLSKPSPRIFDITAERLGLAPVECVMIDDRASNIDGAREAGMNGILYNSLNQAKLDLAKLLDKDNA